MGDELSVVLPDRDLVTVSTDGSYHLDGRRGDPRRKGFSRLVGAVKYVVGVTAAATVVMLFTLGGDQAPTSESGRTPGDGQLQLGERIYASECAICHGDSGQGGTGPALGARLIDEYPDPASQGLVVSRGRNSMDGFATRLTADEIEAVVLYTRTGLP